MFSGRQDENIRTWLYQYEQCMLINQVDKSMWTQLAGIHLTGGTSTWFTSVYSLKDTSNVPWDAFKKKISTAYEPQEYSLVLRGKVQSLKQENNIDTYVNEMRLLLAQIYDMTETDNIENFINGRVKLKVGIDMKNHPLWKKQLNMLYLMKDLSSKEELIKQSHIR